MIARGGDSCPRCRGKLREKRGIEVGHVFKLGAKYSTIFNASYLDAAGQKKIMTSFPMAKALVPKTNGGYTDFGSIPFTTSATFVIEPTDFTSGLTGYN